MDRRDGRRDEHHGAQPAAADQCVPGQRDLLRCLQPTRRCRHSYGLRQVSRSCPRAVFRDD